MREILKKKSVRIVFVVICAVIIAIIAGLAVQSGQKQQKIHDHLELGAKFLDELDYEQAIAEYAAVLEIEPKNQRALNGLETVYLEYAQKMEEDEKLEEAGLLLEQGYRQFEIAILQERAAELKEKLEQEQEQKQTPVVQREQPDLPEAAVTQEPKETESKSELPPLNAAMTPDMFGIAGHSINEEDFEALCEDIGITLADDPNGTYEKRGSIESFFSGYANMTDEDEASLTFFLPESDKADNIYYNKHDEKFSLDLLMTMENADAFLQMADACQISAPIMVGDTYEEWCQLIEKEKLEAKGDIRIDMLGRKECSYQNKGQGLSIVYIEQDGEDFDDAISVYRSCEYIVKTPGHNLSVTIYVEMENETIFSLTVDYR